MRTITVTEAKARLTELVGLVERHEEGIIVTRQGKAAAVLMGFEEYESIRETLAVLSDRQMMADIRAGQQYFKKGGKGIPLEKAFQDKPLKRSRR